MRQALVHKRQGGLRYLRLGSFCGSAGEITPTKRS